MKTKTHLEQVQEVVPPCPKCGQPVHWTNDVPLRTFCWGTEEKPHDEMSALIPTPIQPYADKPFPNWMLGWKTEAQMRKVFNALDLL